MEEASRHPNQEGGEQLNEATRGKFELYEKALAAGETENCRQAWASFTEEEKTLWRKLNGPLMPIP